MKIIHPISTFVDSISYINPDSLQKEGIDAFNERIEEAFQNFSEYVWSKLPHDENDFFPPILDEPCSGIDSSVQEETEEATESLEILGIDDKLVVEEDNELAISYSLNKLNLTIDDIPISMDMLEPYHVDNLSKEKMSQVLEAAVETCQEYAKMMNLFLKRVSEICAGNQAIDNNCFSGEPLEPITSFFHGVNRDKGYLAKVCAKLIDSFWLDKETNVDDFIYFFSGEGYAPYKRLKWMQSSVLLSIFLKEFTTSDRLWKIASKVFFVQSRTDDKYYPVDANKIRCNYSCAQVAEIYPDNLRQVKEMLSVE